MTTATATELSMNLENLKLRHIGPAVKRLAPAARVRLARELTAQLTSAVADGDVDAQHRWTITGLQFLGDRRAAHSLTQALRLTIKRQDRCPSTRNRLMRALGAIRPLEAIEVLVEVICSIDYPVHKQLAAVCINKIVRSHAQRGEAALVPHRPALKRQCLRLRRLSATTPASDVRPYWRIVPGSPKWRDAMRRAIAALDRVLLRKE